VTNIPHTVKLAQEYLSFVISAKSPAGHGIHSPLVFDFVREVLYQKEKSRQLDEIEWYRDWQVNSPVILRNSNFGAGSKVNLKSSPLGRLIKTSSVSSKTGAFLFHLAKWLNAENILEIGTSVGMSTLYLASARPEATIVTLEGDNQRVKYAKHSFEFMNLNNVEVVEGDFDVTLAQALDKLPKLDMVFFDGNHRPEPTLRYFKQCLKCNHEGTAFVFDDIRWSNEMFKAWQVISQHNSVSVSIDLFNVGVILFRKGITKQHFMINF
jgi:predicted O-methyltransferase YrrM